MYDSIANAICRHTYSSSWNPFINRNSGNIRRLRVTSQTCINPSLIKTAFRSVSALRIPILFSASIKPCPHLNIPSTQSNLAQRNTHHPDWRQIRAEVWLYGLDSHLFCQMDRLHGWLVGHPLPDRLMTKGTEHRIRRQRTGKSLTNRIESSWFWREISLVSPCCKWKPY